MYSNNRNTTNNTNNQHKTTTRRSPIYNKNGKCLKCSWKIKSLLTERIKDIIGGKQLNIKTQEVSKTHNIFPAKFHGIFPPKFTAFSRQNSRHFPAKIYGIFPPKIKAFSCQKFPDLILQNWIKSDISKRNLKAAETGNIQPPSTKKTKVKQKVNLNSN